MKKDTTKSELSTVNSYYLSRDIIKICEVFCSKVLHTNADQYYKRKQSDINKIWNDIFYGKISEWGVYFIYLERGRTNVTAPDMKIYSSKQKSFDADLCYGLYNLHVKSQNSESAEKYGDSWIFQSKDPLFASPTEYDIIVGCRVTLDESSKDFIDGALVEIKLEKRFIDLNIGSPKLSKFSGDKKAIYLKDNL
jgi:hypothetical protein